MVNTKKTIFKEDNPFYFINGEFVGHGKFKQFKFKEGYWVTNKSLLHSGFTKTLIKKLQYLTIRIKKDKEQIDVSKTIDVTTLELWKKEFDKPIEPTKPYTMSSRENVMEFLLQNKTDEATEFMVSEFLNKNHIYTTRNDLKSEIWIYNEGIYIPQGKTYIQEYVRSILNESYKDHISNRVIKKIEVDTFIDEDSFFKNHYIYELPVENGILNIKTKKLSDFDPKKIFFNKLPVEYNSDKDCPIIKKHFETVLSKKDDIILMQDIFGYTLVKDHFIEKAVMFTGTGRNGKSKTIELMKRLLGAENVINIPIQHLENDDFIVSELFGKMANISADLSKTALNNTGKFKSLTGRDQITAKRKFLQSISFVSYAKMIFACNELPPPGDDTVAFWSRWAYIDFPYTFKPKLEYDKANEEERELWKIMDSDISEKMQTDDEISGLLNWSLAGFKRILKNKDFSSTQTHEDIQNEWLKKSESITAFANDCIVEDYDSCIEKKEFRKCYIQYCQVHKIKVLNDKIVRDNLKKNFAVEDSRRYVGEGVDKDQVRVWEGIKFRKEIENIDLRQGRQVSHGFSTHNNLSYLAYIGSKRVSSLSYLSQNIDKDKPVVVSTSLILPFLKENDKNGGINFLEIMKKCDLSEENFNKEIEKLLKEGDVFSPEAGKFKVL